jgi:hypothetical protein
MGHAAFLCGTAGGGGTGARRDSVRGASSDVQRVPQRQQLSSWRAIGALQERQMRGM